MPTLNIITNGKQCRAPLKFVRFPCSGGRISIDLQNETSQTGRRCTYLSLSLSLLFRPRPPTVPGNGLDNSDALKALSTAVASATGKPESYVLVSLRTDVALSFGGSEAPAAFGDLLSIGAVGGAKNKTISKAVSDVVTAKLGVPSSRFYLSITDMKGSDFGWNGGTF